MLFDVRGVHSKNAQRPDPGNCGRCRERLERWRCNGVGLLQKPTGARIVQQSYTGFAGAANGVGSRQPGLSQVSTPVQILVSIFDTDSTQRARSNCSSIAFADDRLKRMTGPLADKTCRRPRKMHRCAERKKESSEADTVTAGCPLSASTSADTKPRWRQPTAPCYSSLDFLSSCRKRD